MPQRLKISIEGYVQGVSYRVGALRMARELGLSGFVRNEADGSVMAEVEGPKAQVDQFLDWCRIGPPMAEINNVSFDEIEPLNSSGFNIL